jgi:hypothetical protein
VPAPQLDNFIAGYLEYTKNSESPSSYHIWAAIATVAGALQRRVWMKWGHTEVYPNQYIVLVGPSGKARKGEPVMIGRSFLSSIGIPLVSEDITREGLVQRLRDSVTNYQPPGHGIRFQCAVSCFAEELAVFLGEGDTKFLATLTNWYDSREKWTYETRSRGAEPIEGVCFNLFGSMAEDWIPISIPHTAIGGGFTSRVIFIVESDKGQIVPDPNVISIDKNLRRDLEADLERIYAIDGEYVFSDEALDSYVNWYTTEEEKVKAGKLPISDPRFSGYISRRATHVKKIAMSLAASRCSSLLISVQDFHNALTLLLEAEKNMSSAFGKVGKAYYTEQTRDVMDFIEARKKCTRTELLRSMYQDVDRRALESIEQTLQSMRVIEVDTRAGGGEVVYRWKG